MASEPPVAADFFVQSWQTDEGLPGNAVNCVLQDQTGFIWLATIGGLVRFDGTTLKRFSSPLIAHVAARNIRALAETADARLLMLPAVGGLVQLQAGQFRPHPAGEGLSGRQLQSLFVDRSGAIWIGMDGGRIRRWRDGQISDFGPADGLSSRTGVSFAEDAAGCVWIASGNIVDCYREGKLARFTEYLGRAGYTAVASSQSGGIWIWKGTRLLKLQGDQLSTISTNLPWVALGGVVREMFEDHSQGVWIGTSAHGLFRFAGGDFTRVETSQSQIASITEDGEGDIWVGTIGGGINRLRPKLFQLYDTRSGLPEEVSDAVCADDQGGIWLANRRGGVVRIRDGKASVPQLPGPHKFGAYSVCADDQGCLWVSDRGLYRFPREHPDQVQPVTNGLVGNLAAVHVLFKSRDGDIWIGADPNLLGHYQQGRPENFVQESDFPGRHPRSLAEDSKGRIWIGTEDGQLYQLAAGRFTVFAQPDGLPDAPIRSLCADDDGFVWIGTMGGGLVLRRDEKFTPIAAAAGLPDDNIAELLEDDAGRLWCGTPGGIFHLAKRDLLAFADKKLPKVTAVSFSKNEGLLGISCFGTSQPMACKTPGGRLWFATQQGVLSLDSAALHPNSRPPPVFIDGLFVNDRPLEITDSLQVPPRCNKIEFRFSALSFIAPQQVRLRYKLDGVDPDWVEIVNLRAAVYSALGPGKYQLHLKACNNDGIWNETGTCLSFVVLPAWQQTWWFQGSTLLAGIALSALGIRYWSQRRLKSSLERLEHQQALTKERTRIARDLHDDLGATVTQVGLMLEELRAAPFSAGELKQRSAEISGRVLNLARDLDAVVWSVNPGNDSLGELVAYLSQSFLECFRRTGIRPRLEVMAGIPDSALAPGVRHHLFLVVKEAINNVIKHSQATEVTLSLKVVAQVLEIQIQDNGRGFSPGAMAQSKRHGLPNIQARVQQMGGTLATSSDPAKGTSIRIMIPFWKDLHAQPRT